MKYKKKPLKLIQEDKTRDLRWDVSGDELQRLVTLIKVSGEVLTNQKEQERVCIYHLLFNHLYLSKELEDRM